MRTSILQSPSAWASLQLSAALERLRLAIKAYNPEQPREPAGTEEGGRWVSADDTSDRMTLAGGFKKKDMGMTVQDFFSKMCQGRFREGVAGQFWSYTIKELLDAEANGTPLAHRCYKILNEDRFRKHGR